MTVLPPNVARVVENSITALDYGGGAKKIISGLQLEIDDRALRDVAPGFDGMERAFALVPCTDGTWKRFALDYAPTGRVADAHARRAQDQEIDVARALSDGIAFGFDTNVGTFWLQEYAQNFRPTIRGR